MKEQRTGPNKHVFVRLINKYQLKTAVEVGVAGGGLTQKVMQFCPIIERYYCVDPWKVYTPWFNREPHPWEYNQAHYDNIYNKFMRYAKKWPDRIVVVRKDSTTAAQEFNTKVDTVYIDAIHDKINIINDIYRWLPNIKDSGIIAGHDYAKRFADMVEALHVIFEEELDIDPIKDTVPKMSIGNAMGRNWWVLLSAEKKKKFLDNIENNYGELLWSKFPEHPHQLQN